MVIVPVILIVIGVALIANAGRKARARQQALRSIASADATLAYALAPDRPIVVRPPDDMASWSILKYEDQHGNPL